jgi:DNA-binding protein YbaB
MHPEVVAVLRQARRLQQIMDDQIHKMNVETFTATDESRTVEVTLDGYHTLTDVLITDGLLRRGVAAVQHGVNEALANAKVHATESITADRSRINELLAEIAGRR